MQGIKETKESLVGMLALTQVLAKHFKDGVQTKDFLAIYSDIINDEELKQKLQDAFEGYKLIDDELKSITLSEGVELLVAVVPEIEKLIEELRA